MSSSASLKQSRRFSIQKCLGFTIPLVFRLAGTESKSPSYGELALRLLLAGHEVALFELKDVEGFRIVMDNQREALVVTFAGSVGFRTLCFT